MGFRVLGLLGFIGFRPGLGFRGLEYHGKLKVRFCGNSSSPQKRIKVAYSAATCQHVEACGFGGVGALGQD